jgi:hypothetical protein
MLELDKIFVAKNKKALLEEIAMQLAKARELIDVASVNPEAVSGAFVGLAAAIGSIDSHFKEYMLLRRGEIPTPNVIGFQIFEDEEEEDLSKELVDHEEPEGKRRPKKS